jgi:hypothetical protein
MRPAPASHPADTVTLTLRLPRNVYDALVIWRDEADGSVEEFAAALLAQAANFGSPASLYGEVDGALAELNLLRARLKILELQLAAEAELEPGYPS